MTILNIRQAYQIASNDGLRKLSKSTVGYLLNLCFTKPTRIRMRALRYRLEGHPGVGDPLRVYEIRVDDLTHCLTNSEFPEPTGGFKITGGSWEADAIRFDAFPLYRMLEQHFVAGVPWEKTERFKSRKEKLQTEGSFGELDLAPAHQSIDAYREYLHYLDTVYRRIDEDGYKRQRELSSDADFLERSIECPALGEIELFVGREGKLMVSSGLHRACIAKLLDLDTIPVRTLVRHRDWQEVRDKIATVPRTELDEETKRHLSHPEVTDLV